MCTTISERVFIHLDIRHFIRKVIDSFRYSPCSPERRTSKSSCHREFSPGNELFRNRPSCWKGLCIKTLFRHNDANNGECEVFERESGFPFHFVYRNAVHPGQKCFCLFQKLDSGVNSRFSTFSCKLHFATCMHPAANAAGWHQIR